MKNLQILWNILLDFINFFLLPKNTRQMIEVNRLWNRWERILAWTELQDIKTELHWIQHKHARDLEFFISLWEKYVLTPNSKK